MSKEERLKELLRQRDVLDAEQASAKLLMNAFTGVLGSQSSELYSPALYEAITMQGRQMTRIASVLITSYFKGAFQKDEELHKRLGISTERAKTLDINTLDLPKDESGNPSLEIYSNTDSVSGDTKVYVDEYKQRPKVYSIADLWNKHYNLLKEHEHFKNDGKEYIFVGNMLMFTPTFNGDHVCSNQVSYLYKHKVKKEMFAIKASDGTEVKVTSDHSVFVHRDGKVIQVSPSEIQKGDKLIKLKDINYGN